ncbi:MAG: glycosyltransferase family 9 protein [Pseudomonadota bacterium]
MGDALLKWPVISGLKHRFPAIHLTWVAGTRTSVFAGSLAGLAAGTIDAVIDKSNIGNSWRELVQAKPSLEADVVISTEPKIRNAVLAKRIQHKKFISPAARFWFSDIKPAKAQAIPTSVQSRLQQLFELALGDKFELRHHVEIPERLKQTAAKLLPSRDNYIGLAPGAGGQRKRWPLAKFIAVAKAQIEENKAPVFFLGPEEISIIEEIKTAVPDALIPEYDDQMNRRAGGVMLSIALANRMQVSLANDAGGGHILAAGGKPLVQVYGHTSSEKFRSSYGPHSALTAEQFGGKTVSAIPVSAVVDAIRQLQI